MRVSTPRSIAVKSDPARTVRAGCSEERNAWDAGSPEHSNLSDISFITYRSAPYSALSDPVKLQARLSRLNEDINTNERSKLFRSFEIYLTFFAFHDRKSEALVGPFNKLQRNDDLPST